MSNRVGSTFSSGNPILAESVFVTAVLFGVYLWHRTMRVVTDPVSEVLGSASALSGLPVGGLATANLFVAGLVLFVGGYAGGRGIEVGLTLPSRTDLTPVGLAGIVPPVFVSVTKLVGSLTGVPYSSLTMTYYSADAPLLPVLTILGLGIFVGVPSLVLICQVLVQGSFRQSLGADRAVALTTLVTGFVLMNDTGGLATAPKLGKLIGAVVFVVLLGVAVYATEFGGEKLRYVGSIPLALFGAVVVYSGVTGIESIADGLFTVTQLAVLGVAAYAYERSGSLFVPALAYLSFLLANAGVGIIFEAGLQP